jgi:8-oxo-dGTP diphosphatase
LHNSVAVDVVAVVMTIADESLKTLFVQVEDGKWALPGRDLNIGEALSDAVKEVCHSQTGVEIDYLEQLYTFDHIDSRGNEHRLEVAYYGLVPHGELNETRAGSGSAAWYSETAQPKLAAGHLAIADLARKRLRGKLAYTAVGFELLPEKFSLAELQQLHEVILGKRIDKRNFRKKIGELGILEATGEERAPQSGRGRPASLFRFRPEVFRQIDARGDIFHF